jgi:hypothetical protein
MPFAAMHESPFGRCCKSRLQRIGPVGLSLRAVALTHWPRRYLRNSDATRCTELKRVVAERPALLSPRGGTDQLSAVSG